MTHMSKPPSCWSSVTESPDPRDALVGRIEGMVREGEEGTDDGTYKEWGRR